MKRPFFFLIFLCVTGLFSGPQLGAHTAQRSLVLAFYNTENFFDTLPASRGGDEEYTPLGARRWTSERYTQKIARIARVLDSLRADVVGLAEVESEAVLRDLVSALRVDYNYIFRPTASGRGIHVALLYRGSLFSPLQVRTISSASLTRPVLSVKGRLGEDTVTLLVGHLPSLLNKTKRRQEAAQSLRSALDDMLEHNPRERIILMGDFNMSPASTLARESLGLAPWPGKTGETPEAARRTQAPPFYTPFAALARRGYGSYAYRDRWYLYDYMALSPAWLPETAEALDTRWQFKGRCGIFAPDFLLQDEGPGRGYPRRTFERGAYTDGYSDHLPVYLILEK